jgi:hypothetical protein
LIFAFDVGGYVFPDLIFWTAATVRNHPLLRHCGINRTPKSEINANTNTNPNTEKPHL